MAAAEPPTRRSQPRYSLRRELPVEVRHEGAADAEAAAQARLLDLSTGGAKLAIDVVPNMTRALDLRVVEPDLGIDLRASAKVCWVRPETGGGYVVGCAFGPALPPEALETFFQHELLERRRFTRRAALGRAQARWEMGEAEVPVDLLDVSNGGFSFRVAQATANVGRLLLRLPAASGKPRDILAVARWRSAIVGGEVVGCEFASADGQRALRAHLDQTVGPPLAGGSVRRLSLFTLVGVVALLAVVAAHLLLR